MGFQLVQVQPTNNKIYDILKNNLHLFSVILILHYYESVRSSISWKLIICLFKLCFAVYVLPQTPHLKALTSEWILDLKCLFILNLALALTGSSISREQSGHWNLNLPPPDSISIGSTYKQINLFQYIKQEKNHGVFEKLISKLKKISIYSLSYIKSII